VGTVRSKGVDVEGHSLPGMKTTRWNSNSGRAGIFWLLAACLVHLPCASRLKAADPLLATNTALRTYDEIQSKWSALPQSDVLKAAEGGDRDAQYWLGMVHFKQAVDLMQVAFEWSVRSDGSTTESPKREAVQAKWGHASEAEVRRAAVGGDHEAQKWVADFESAKGTVAYETANAWLKKAAQGGLCVAMTQLAWGYRHGSHGLPLDWKEAMRLFQAAAEQGCETSQHRLAEMLIQCNAPPNGLADGIEWLRRAADQGCAQAQFELAQEYSCGNGEPRNPGETTVALYTKAAEAGLLAAQYALAERYRTGLGVTADKVKAYVWYSMAAEGGKAEALDQEAKLKSVLSAADQQRARAIRRALPQSARARPSSSL
jgi:TPR repeat protein